MWEKDVRMQKQRPPYSPHFQYRPRPCRLLQKSIEEEFGATTTVRSSLRQADVDEGPQNGGLKSDEEEVELARLILTPIVERAERDLVRSTILLLRQAFLLALGNPPLLAWGEVVA